MVMSALHLKADICGANRHVCFGPIADIRTNRPATGIASSWHRAAVGVWSLERPFSILLIQPND